MAYRAITLFSDVRSSSRRRTYRRQLSEVTFASSVFIIVAV